MCWVSIVGMAIPSAMDLMLSPEQPTSAKLEDCEEAMAGLYDLRDLYQPPEASGLVLDDDDEAGDVF